VLANVALHKMVYESLEDVNDSGSYTQLPYNFCISNDTGPASSEGSWWTIDLTASYHIGFVEISPQLGSLCPENSMCGQ